MADLPWASAEAGRWVLVYEEASRHPAQVIPGSDDFQ